MHGAEEHPENWGRRARRWAAAAGTQYLDLLTGYIVTNVTMETALFVLHNLTPSSQASSEEDERRPAVKDQYTVSSFLQGASVASNARLICWIDSFIHFSMEMR